MVSTLTNVIACTRQLNITGCLQVYVCTIVILITLKVMIQ